MFNVYKNQLSRQTGSRNLTGPKTLPTIWGTYMKLVTKYQISAEKNVAKNVHICSMCIKNNYVGKQEVGIWRVQKRFLYMHIFLSNYWWQQSDIWSQALYRYPISWEAFLDPSDSYFLFTDFVDFYTHWTYMLIFRRIFLSNYWWQKSDIWSQASYRCPKTLPTIWHTYMKLVTKYNISAINSYWEKCDEKHLGMDERTDRRTLTNRNLWFSRFFVSSNP
jgi:hypothetical protein